MTMNLEKYTLESGVFFIKYPSDGSSEINFLIERQQFLQCFDCVVSVEPESADRPHYNLYAHFASTLTLKGIWSELELW